MSLIKKTALAAALSVYPFAANAQIDNWVEVFRCEEPSDKGIAPFYAGKMQSGYCLRISSSVGEVCGKHDILGSIKIKSKGKAKYYLKSDDSVFADDKERPLSGLTKYGSQDYYELPAFTSWLTSADENQNGGFVISLEVKDLCSVSTEIPFNVSPYAVVHMKPSRQVDCASSCVSPRQIPSDFDANDCWMCDMAAGWTAGSEMSFKYRPMTWCQAAEDAVNDAGFVVTDGSVPADCRYAFADDKTSIELDALELDACADTDAKCQTNYYSVPRADLSMKSGIAEIKNTVDDVGFFDLRIGGYTDPNTGLAVKGSQMRLDAKIVPHGFALQHGDTGGVINSCRRNEDGKKSFTYFGQPFETDFSIEAVNAKGVRTTRFNKSEFADIDLYEVTLAAMPYPSLQSSGMQEERGSQRLLLSLSDKNDGSPIAQKEVWQAGSFVLATPGRASSLQDYKVSLKVLPNGYASASELGRDDMARTSDGSYKRKYSSDVASKTEDPRGNGSARAIVGVGVNLFRRNGTEVSFMTQKTPVAEFSFRDLSSPETKTYLKSLSAIPYSGNPYGKGTAAFALSAVNGILDLRIGRIALKDAKAAPGNYLFMPVVFEEYRKRLDNEGNTVWSGWLRNADDSCSVLTTRQLYATTMSSNLDDAEKPVALGNGEPFKYKDRAGQQSSSIVLVNQRSVSAEALSRENEAHPGQTDQYAIAKDGLMYLRVSPPSLGLPAKLSIGTPAVGNNYELDLPQAVTQNVASALCAYEDAGYLSANAEWLCFHLENDSAAEGSFDGWPGRQRILFRYDLLPDFARH